MTFALAVPSTGGSIESYIQSANRFPHPFSGRRNPFGAISAG